MSAWKKIFVVVIAVIAVMAVRAAPAQTASFTGLGDLPGGPFISYAWGVSDNGSVVVGESYGASGQEAFRWTHEGRMIGLGGLSSSRLDSRANGVSADGSIVVGGSESVGGSEDAPASEAFHWTETGGMVGLGYLHGRRSDSTRDFLGSFSGSAADVSADGSVVVGESRSPYEFIEAFRWTQKDGMIGLGSLTGSFAFASEARGVSADGSVVVGVSSNQAFRWTQAGEMVGLNDLPGGNFFSVANAVSGDGSVIVGWSSSELGAEAFRWTETGAMIGLGHLPGSFSNEAMGVSGDGSVIVGKSDSESGQEAFIWDMTHGMRSLKTVLIEDFKLDLIGWKLDIATEVSADGLTIVGYGTNPEGSTEGWIANLYRGS
jgi:probable HAF family extracellular repeat protein